MSKKLKTKAIKNVDPDLWLEMKVTAAMSNATVSDFVQGAIREKINRILGYDSAKKTMKEERDAAGNNKTLSEL